MKKNISKILIFILSIQLLMPYFWWSFAQDAPKCEANPPVCWATPESMALYLDFQREVAALIQTKPFKTASETVSEGEWGIFANELLKLEELKNFDDSLAGQALKIFYTANVRSATALITSAFLFELAGLSTLADNSVGLTILLHDRPIVRDWAKLLDIERNLNQTAYHLGQAGEIARTIVDTAPLKALLKKYESAKLLKNTSSFNSSIPYMDLLSTLASLNIAVKTFLAYGATDSLTLFQKQGLYLNETWIAQLKQDYHCTRWTGGFKCNRSWKSLSTQLKNLISSTSKQGQGSWKTMQHAWNNLKSALELAPAGIWSNIQWKSSNDYLTEREKTLLRDVYGLDTTRMTKDKAMSIISFNTRSKDQWKSIAKGAKSGWDNVIKPSYQAIASLTQKETRNTLKGNIAAWISKHFNRSTADILTTIQNENQLYFPQTETLNHQMIVNLQALALSRMEAEMLAYSTDNSVLTYQIGELSAIIKQIIDTIGTKEKNLRKNLNAVCSYQASNKWNAGCYVQ